jgi:DNA adenine methylase
MARHPAHGPVLKWAGGKRQLLDKILERLPKRIATYYEPFVGGAAVFFALAKERRFERAVLADANQELVEVYLAIKEDVGALIRALRKLAAGHSQEQYYRVRAQNPRSRTQRAARVIYLNKTGYNGLYRVNRAGEFNVPYGRYEKPNVCDEPRLCAAAEALADATVEVADFEQICRRARPGDAVYLDPPYVPLSKTSSFTAYDRHPFDLDAHRRLARTFADLAERDVFALLSNSNTPETCDLYAGWQVELIDVKRPINSRADARGPVSELLVSSRRAAASRRARTR